MTESNALDPELFGPGQARDARFDVKDRWSEMVNHPQKTPEYRREFLHRQMNEEINVLEQAALSLVDFPDEDWEIRMWLARQCADEARHGLVYMRLMQERGIAVGEYPIINFQFRVLSKIDTLIGRLAVENRTFEADGLDAATFGAEEVREEGDDELADIMEAQAADEIVHVGFANDWINRKVAENPVNMLKISAALTKSSKAFEEVFDGSSGVRYPVSEQARVEAGFTEAEVEVAARLAAERQA